MICIAGKNKIAVDALLYLLKIGITRESILGVINKTDDGQHGWQPSFKATCEREGIRIVQLEEIYEQENLIFLSLEFDRIIKPKKFRSTNLYNIHFSLLPAYKGMYTSVLPILNGEYHSGVTLHRIDAGIDTGEIIDQVKFDLPEDANGQDLYWLYLKYAFQLFQQNIGALLKKQVISTPQSAKGASYFSKSTINFKTLQIDLNKTAQEVHNQIRGFAFRPYQLPSVNGTCVSHSQISSIRSTQKPGILLESNHFFDCYSTIDYDVLLYKDMLQPILIAAEKGDLEFIDTCYKNGYKLYEKNDKGWDPLIVSAYHEQWSVFEYLLDTAGLDPNSVNVKGTSVLMYAMTAASQSGRLDFMSTLIDKGGHLIHSDYAGISLLSYAKMQGNAKVIQFLNDQISSGSC